MEVAACTEFVSVKKLQKKTLAKDSSSRGVPAHVDEKERLLKSGRVFLSVTALQSANTFPCFVSEICHDRKWYMHIQFQLKVVFIPPGELKSGLQSTKVI